MGLEGCGGGEGVESWRIERWRGRGRRHRRDAGSATVWTVFAAAALCVVFAALVGFGQAVTARHRAGGAADLAALAAADHALRGEAKACAAARRVAAAQHTRLVRCSLAAAIADVSAEAGDSPFTSRVRARAGPPTTSEAGTGAIPRAGEGRGAGRDGREDRGGHGGRGADSGRREADVGAER
ncbi:Rv3654c family TadE-like protein [Streptomyces sp. NPDC101393]|uniref:Rv3654c family TadE-like protein n=1 Tax=Streptomyces sp. NPDC101393 TaxID=3366141 RepID=UPI0038138AAD